MPPTGVKWFVILIAITMELTTSDDMLVAALVIGAALVAFICVLYLNREDRRKQKKSDARAADVAEGGTVLVQEGGRVVRRSTRYRTHMASEGFLPV